LNCDKDYKAWNFFLDMIREGVAIIADPKGEGYYFAKGIYEYLKTKMIDVILVDIEKFIFKDNEFKVRIMDNIRRKKCFIIHDSNKNPCEWYTELNFILEAMTFSSPSEINVVLPYTRFARQDRKEASRVSVNSKALADMVSKYADRGMTVDLHAAQIQEFFDIPFDNLYSYPALIDFLEQNYREILGNLVIVSPDIGGAKRAESFVKRLARRGIKADIAIGFKTRERENIVGEIKIMGNVEGKNCLLVDDIIDTGGTMIKTAEVLKQKGARNVFAYVTHGLFTEGTEKFGIFDKVLVSDTLNCDGNFEVVSLIRIFGEAIYRTVMGKSLSVLFD